jgi:ABC-type antimicrobial peptide transport system permease subunit
VREIDPAIAIYGATTMASLQRERTAQDRLGAIVSGAFAVFGLLLAGCSLYGLMSYSVEQRRAEMGVRLALGARPRAILALVLRQALVRLAAGLAVGVVLALGVNQLLRSAITDLPWVDWSMLAGLAGVMTVVTAAAVMVPALRATRIDPTRSLRG